MMVASAEQQNSSSSAAAEQQSSGRRAVGLRRGLLVLHLTENTSASIVICTSWPGRRDSCVCDVWMIDVRSVPPILPVRMSSAHLPYQPGMTRMYANCVPEQVTRYQME